MIRQRGVERGIPTASLRFGLSLDRRARWAKLANQCPVNLILRRAELVTTSGTAEGRLSGRYHASKWAVGLCAALALGCPSHASGAGDPASKILSKATWAGMDWQHPEGSALWKSLTWGARGDGTVKKSTVTLWGTQFKAMFLGGRLHFYANDTFPSCDGLESKTAARFGKPSGDDGSIVIPFAETRSMKMVMVAYQWDLGSTRILASCTGLTSSPADPSDPDKLTWSLTFASPARLPKLIPKFALRCTRTISYPDGTTHQAPDFAMWIDPDMQNVTNADGVVIADNVTFAATDSSLRFSVTRNAVRSEYVIDRITGALSATIIQNGQQGGTISGKCDKASTLEAKF